MHDDDDVECEGNRKRRSSIDGTNRDKHRDTNGTTQNTHKSCAFVKKDTKAKKNTKSTYMQDTVLYSTVNSTVQQI
jgi:hypothetical protein